MKDNKKFPYIYTSSQLGKYFGITIKGIEYYEKKQLISPERVGNNKQRRFDLANTYRIFMARYLRQSGFDLNNTLDVLNSTNKDSVIEYYNNLLENLKQKQIRLNSVIKILENNCGLLEKINNKSFFEIVDSPVFKRLFLREMDGPHKSNKEQTEEYRNWNELMPITNASIKYAKKDVLKKTSKIEPDIGMIITEDNFKKFNLKDSPRVTTIKSKKCLHTVVVGNAQRIESKEWLDSIRKYLHDNYLQLNGDIITSLLLVLDNKKVQIRYDEAWIPITDKQK